MRNKRNSRRPEILAACTAGIVSAAIASYAAAQTNLLLDYNFAAGVDGSPDATDGDVPMTSGGPWLGWNNWVSPYSGYYCNTASTGLPTTDDGLPNNGGSNQYGKTFSGSNGGIYQYVSVTGGDTYTASAQFDNSAIANNGEDELTTGETDDVRMIFFSGADGTGTNLGTYVSPTNVNENTPTDTWTQLSVTAAAPAGAESVQWMAFFYNPDYEGGALYVDDTSLVQVNLTPTWTGNGADDNWMTAGNWSTAPVATNSLVFDGTTQTTNNNNFAANTQFDGITFNPTAGSFVLGGNSIALGGNIVNNSPNAQAVNLGLALQQNTTLDAASGAISVGGAISGAYGLTTTGSVTLSGANSYSGGTTVSGGNLVIAAAGALPANGAVSITSGTLQLGLNTGGETLTSLTIGANSSLDIGNNHIIISDPGGTIDAAIETYLANGFNGGGWNGTSSGGSIVTSAPTSTVYGIGWADGASGGISGISSGQLEIKYTLYGDTNLDGVVTGVDFGNLAANFGKSGANIGWAQGAFTYNNSVTGVDFGLLAGNFGKSLGGAGDVATAADWAALDAFAEANGLMSYVPEPASMGLIALGCVGVLARRRRRVV